ncbi:FAD-dependent oxidoreductase [Granulicella sp. S190]|uniref:FAD-dependent oxidoreductase n=1 Tax=Granulicella sp. S190 TaxID=1747226 RepID=UPI0015770788|nr:FAD-dependent oxidoreductase [Granulicella sp. S190]
MSQSVEVLIVGAGPTGLALACDLARRRVAFKIIDLAPAYFIGSKGKGLQPRSLEVLDDFGIIDEILRLGKFHIPFRGYDGSKVLGERDIHEGRNPTPSTPYASPLIIRQWRVEERLRALLEKQGGKVELSTELVGLEQDESGVAAKVRREGGEETIHCQYLVAADGGRSFVRKLLEVPFEGETWTDERMYVGDVRLRGLDREAWHSWPNHPDGLLALCPLPSTDMFQFQAQIPKGEEHEPSLELFQRIVNERAGGMDIELIDAPWLSLYRANVRMAARFRIGRVFLAGDAAHVHSPAGGQGMNTGIQDAYNLGWKLESVLRGAPDALLDTYEEERLPVAASVLGLSTKLHRQITGNGEEKLRRDAVTLQLGITYKEMSLSKRSGDVNLKIAAGDRAPDAPGLDLEGKPIRLFDVFRGPQFTLMRLFPGKSARAIEGELVDVKRVDVLASPSIKDAASASKIFVDAFGHVAESYGGGPGDCLLVRSDGYVGWIGPEIDFADLQDYLGQVSAK